MQPFKNSMARIRQKLIFRSQLQNLQLQGLPFAGSVLAGVRPQLMNLSPIIIKNAAA